MIAWYRLLKFLSSFDLPDIVFMLFSIFLNWVKKKPFNQKGYLFIAAAEVLITVFETLSFKPF
jgi:hypothetical protein